MYQSIDADWPAYVAAVEADPDFALWIVAFRWPFQALDHVAPVRARAVSIARASLARRAAEAALAEIMR